MPTPDKPLMRSARLEGLALATLLCIFLAWSIRMDAFQSVAAFATGGAWHLDQVLLAMMAASAGLALFSMRRIAELRQETSARLAAETKLREMILHDPLTGLPNRAAIEHDIDLALANAATVPFALAMIDIKRLKSINALHGHNVGDQVLLAVARQLESLVGPDDMVVRLGGGAFLVLLRATPPGEGLIARIRAISSSFARPLECASLQKAHLVSASIGVTSIGRAGVSADAAMAQSGVAMRRAKADPGNSYSFFEEGMDSAARGRAQMEIDLREAIASRHIVPHFQPIVEQASGRIVGYEALARWQEPDGTCHPPEQFIGVAEETGQIHDLFYLILEQAARVLARTPHLFVSVNLSPVQLADPWLVENTLRVLATAGLQAGRLEIEITEAAFTADVDGMRRLMAEFKRQRIRISLDDFGTGYSSFRLLKELEFDKLKIDRSFVDGLESNRINQAIVHAIATMAHLLGMEVTLEGIETSEVAELAGRLGCEFGQGYLYGCPAPGLDSLAGEVLRLPAPPLKRVANG